MKLVQQSKSKINMIAEPPCIHIYTLGSSDSAVGHLVTLKSF